MMSTLDAVTVAEQRHYYDLCMTHKDWQRGELKEMLDIIVQRYVAGHIKEMLEVGCGVADMISHLPAGLRYTGLDLTEYPIQVARAHYPGVSFVVGSAERIPLADKSYGAVFSFQTLQSFRDPRRALAEMTRVVRPGGYLFLIAPNLECPWGTVNAMRHYSPMRRLFFTIQRAADMALRLFGRSAFRLIPQTYVEATGTFERKDDDLKYLVSTWEVMRVARALGLTDAGTKRARSAWMRFIGPLQYYRGGLFAVLQKPGQLW